MRTIIDEVVDRITRATYPRSVFVYGSSARGESAGADIEVGVVFDTSNYVGRTGLQGLFQGTTVRAYPFETQALLAGKVRTPFVKAFFMRDLRETAKTIHGADLVGRFPVPALTRLDILLEVRFAAGRALSALIAHRHQEWLSTADSFAKSFLHASRALLVSETGAYRHSHGVILDVVGGVVPKEYAGLPDAVRRVRLGQVPSSADIYANLEFASQFCETAAMRHGVNALSHALLPPISSE